MLVEIAQVNDRLPMPIEPTNCWAASIGRHCPAVASIRRALWTAATPSVMIRLLARRLIFRYTAVGFRD